MEGAAPASQPGLGTTAAPSRDSSVARETGHLLHCWSPRCLIFFLHSRAAPASEVTSLTPPSTCPSSSPVQRGSHLIQKACPQGLSGSHIEAEEDHKCPTGLSSSGAEGNVSNAASPL